MSDKNTWIPLAGWCAAGVLLRLAFLFATRGIDFVADEGFYVQSALAWNHYGFYADQYRYLWPPGYPFVLARCLAYFGADGIFAAKLLQVAASASVGLCTMLLARRLFGGRASSVAGALWCFYLPLIGFTHTLWSETLFLALFMPGLLLAARVLAEPEAPPTARRVVAAGACFAAALYFKQAVLLLLPLLAALFLFRAGPSAARRAWVASLFLLATGSLVLPWTLRNAEVYGRLVPMGSTLGENAYRGMNGRYTNFDTALVAARLRAVGTPPPRPRPGLVDDAPGPAWERAEEELHTIDRQSEGLRRGVAFASDYPGWWLKSRVQKLADWVAPLSFFLRHQALGGYADTPLAGTAARRASVIWALLCPLLVMGLAVAGATKLPATKERTVTLTVLAYFGATALLVAMSRFRIPVVPLLIALASGALADRAPTRVLTAATGITLLLGLWWLDFPLVLAVARAAWEGAP